MMNFNILAYFIYGVITIFTIVYIGRLLHKNGRPYVLMFIDDVRIGDAINNALLVGYYLVNIGYILLTLSYWTTIGSALQLLEMISLKTGTIYLLLGILHCMNMLSLFIYGQWKLRTTNGSLF